VTDRRRAGEPEVPRRPAGAPEAPTGPAGADPGASERRPGEKAQARVARGDAVDSAGLDAGEVERDIEALLADVKRERDEYLELARRTRADFENYRRRAAQEARDAERRGKVALARELVPALDNLERALRAAGVDPDNPPAGAGDGRGLTHGVGLVYRELRATLERAGVETYDPTGERFDPNWHEALATRAEEGTDAGVVLETVEKGYRLDGQVLRAAKVIVSA
jgi:molecular chaperone GrpE